jgi:hypothetical protein
MLLADFSVKIGGGNFITLKVANDKLQEFSNNNGVCHIERSFNQKYNVPTL